MSAHQIHENLHTLANNNYMDTLVDAVFGVGRMDAMEW